MAIRAGDSVHHQVTVALYSVADKTVIIAWSEYFMKNELRDWNSCLSLNFFRARLEPTAGMCCLGDATAWLLTSQPPQPFWLHRSTLTQSLCKPLPKWVWTRQILSLSQVCHLPRFWKQSDELLKSVLQATIPINPSPFEGLSDRNAVAALLP